MYVQPIISSDCPSLDMTRFKYDIRFYTITTYYNNEAEEITLDDTYLSRLNEVYIGLHLQYTTNTVGIGNHFYSSARAAAIIAPRILRKNR